MTGEGESFDAARGIVAPQPQRAAMTEVSLYVLEFERSVADSVGLRATVERCAASESEAVAAASILLERLVWVAPFADSRSCWSFMRVVSVRCGRLGPKGQRCQFGPGHSGEHQFEP